MSHPFYRTAANVSGLPSRIQPTVWDKLGKVAHRVWEVQSADNDEIIPVRKEEEMVEPQMEEVFSDGPDLEGLPEIGPGNIVLLLLGGRELRARVLSKWEDDTYSLVSDSGYLDNVDKSWLKKVAQAAPAPDPSRTITRDDIPVQPGPQAPMSGDPEATDSLQQLLQSRGGHIAVELTPSSILELQSSPSGVAVTLWHTSTQAAMQQTYPNVQSLVSDLNLKGTYPERPVQSLQRQ
jgi:hypothetical protein